MLASDKFKDELRDNNFIEAFKTALSEAMELEIVTWVVPVDQGELDHNTPENGLPGHRMRTRINLIDGDIANEISSHFVGNGPYTELRQFHLEQVQKGQDIIQKNLLNLKLLFEILVERDRGLSHLHSLNPNSVAKRTDSLWPSVGQHKAILVGDEPPASEEPDSSFISGNLETVV